MDRLASPPSWPSTLSALNRRKMLAMTAVGAAALIAGPRATWAQERTGTSARIVIVGAGAGGLAVANRLAAALDGAKITLIDARKAHYFQPGLPLVGAGRQPVEYILSATTNHVPANVELIEANVSAFDPDSKSLETDSGQTVSYDYLIVATGLAQDTGAIEGFEAGLIGREGIGSVYLGPEAAVATWGLMSDFAGKGGRAVFARPATDIKCPAAPLRYTFFTEDHLRQQGTRDKAEIIYNSGTGSLIGMPALAERLSAFFDQRGIAVNYNRVLASIDPGRRIATFRTPDGTEEQEYDFLHIVPPMRAPDVVKNSALAWQEGDLAAGGWLEVNAGTFRHERYPEVFGIGDIAGVPMAKTAGSVMAQVPVMVEQLRAQIADREATLVFTRPESSPMTATGEQIANHWEEDITGFKAPYMKLIGGES